MNYFYCCYIKTLIENMYHVTMYIVHNVKYVFNQRERCCCLWLLFCLLTRPMKKTIYLLCMPCIRPVLPVIFMAIYYKNFMLIYHFTLFSKTYNTYANVTNVNITINCKILFQSWNLFPIFLITIF